MQTLLNVLGAVALMVWGIRMVRMSVLRVFGANLRRMLSQSVGGRLSACCAGIGVTTVLQSSTATALIVASFHSQAFVTLPTALAIMLGADIGTAVVAQILTLKLSWLAPLLIAGGVIVAIVRDETNAGRAGRIALGLGLVMLALQIISATTRPLADSDAVPVMLRVLSDDPLLGIVLGAILSVVLYSSLAVVLLVAALSLSGIVGGEPALALVLGANLGSGVLAALMTLNGDAPARRITAGNLLFKIAGVVALIPLLGLVSGLFERAGIGAAHAVPAFHLLFNILLAAVFLGLSARVARLAEMLLPERARVGDGSVARNLDPTALDTPAVAISCAAREALRISDVIERMLDNVLALIRSNDRQLLHETREMERTVDQLYTAVKLYLTRINQEGLSAVESRRWTDVVSFAINMEQIGDITERVLNDLAERKVERGTSFSDAGVAELCELHACIKSNLRLAMAVFLSGDLRSAERLLREKANFRELERRCTSRHLLRLSKNASQSVDTSSLHLDLVADLRRINSLICSVAYPILEAAGALTWSRLRDDGAADREIAPSNG